MSKQYSITKVENKLLDELTTEGFYIYCMLRFRYIPFTYEATITSIDLLTNEIQLYSHVTKNRNTIKDILLFLQDREHIKINYEGELRNNTPLKIRFNSINPTSEYIALNNKYATIADSKYLYVIATITRWRNMPDKTFSLAEWADKLDVSVRTMQRIFDRMQEQSLIRIVSGDYYNNEKGELRQENNRYYLTGDFEQIQQKDEPVQASSVRTTRIEKSEQAIPKQDSNLVVDVDGLIAGKYTDKRLLEHDNLITYKKLKPFDFEIYLTTDDKVLKAHCDEVVFPNISQKESGKKYVDNMLSKTRLKLQQREAHRKQQEALIGNTPPPERLEWEYKKRDKEEIG